MPIWQMKSLFFAPHAWRKEWREQGWNYVYNRGYQHDRQTPTTINLDDFMAFMLKSANCVLRDTPFKMGVLIVGVFLPRNPGRDPKIWWGRLAPRDTAFRDHTDCPVSEHVGEYIIADQKIECEPCSNCKEPTEKHSEKMQRFLERCVARVLRKIGEDQERGREQP